MRLPYTQVAVEVFEVSAPELALALEVSENDALAFITRMQRGALARCRDDVPPSESDTLTGPLAQRFAARLAGYQGDAKVFCEACSGLSFPVLELVDGGVRFRGLDRYDAAWEAPKGRSEKGKAAAAVRWAPKTNAPAMLEPYPVDAQPMPEAPSPDAQPMLEPCSADAQAMLGDAKIETKTQTKKETAAAVAQEPVEVGVLVVEPPDSPPAGWLADDFWRWAQAKRQAAGLVAERRRPNPRALSAWYSTALGTVRDVEALQEAFYRFGDSAYWQKQAPSLPFAGFMAQWDQFVPRRAHAST